MKDVQEGDTTWEARFTHERCGTSFTAESSDLKMSRFKRPGTYYFDGSADAAGLVTRFFVECPLGDDILFVDTDAVPAALRHRLLQGE